MMFQRIESVTMASTKETFGMSSPVFDYDDFLHRIDGDVDLLKEVILIFLKDTPELLEEHFTLVNLWNHIIFV